MVAAIVLAWPMLATGGYLIFSDTGSYIRGGHIIWQMGLDLLGHWFGGTGDVTALSSALSSADGSSVPGAINERGEPYVLRSFIYSLYTLAAGAAIWPAAFALLQAAATLWMLFALIPPAAASRPGVLAAGFVYLATVTTLPWFTAYLMPDILAAAVVIYGAVLIRRFDDLNSWQRGCLGGIAAFAIVAHYGHVPLAAGLFALVLIWRAVTRRLTRAVMLAAIVPVLFAPLANLSASSVALDRPSVTPMRLPILLARSIDDGPARWYLEDVCPEADLTFCKVFGDHIPQNIPQFLWDEGGIDSITPKQLEGIRDEELTIVLRAFLAYPVQQTTSLLGNAARQLVQVGTGEIRIAHLAPDGTLEGAGSASADAVVSAFKPITIVGTWAAAVFLAGMWLTGRLSREQTEILAVVILGLVVNAAVFGGLSAPVDRYQSRIIWILPALVGIFLAERSRSSTADAGRRVPQ